MTFNPIPDHYRADSLFLLVGANPLPNYVSAVLLAHEHATVYLLHSAALPNASTPETRLIAELLREALKKKRPDLKIELRDMNEVDNLKIETKIREIVEKDHILGDVGLNYTGGTKPMATHTYRWLAEHTEKFEKLIFSYLDARTQGMRIDGLSSPFPVARGIQLNLAELLEIHGYVLPGYHQKSPRKVPRHQVLYHALAEVHSSKDGCEQWRDWRRQGHRDPVTGEERPTDLPDPAKYPTLRGVRQAMDDLCGGHATPELVARALNPKWSQLESCRKWFAGEWLEELALEAVHNNASALSIQDYGINLEPEPGSKLKASRTYQAIKAKNLEFDVAAIIAHQLFAVSCIVSTEAGGMTKQHLFEAFVRARQLGGDEARVALVCCTPTPESVEAEVAREWQAEGQLQVFGMYDLLNLTARFRSWFEKARL